MNVSAKSTLHGCTSCQLCAAICPKSAISIVLDYEGFYRPIVDDALCVDCGLCVNSCYKYDAEVSDNNDSVLKDSKLYGAYVNDKNVLEQTSSGGIADLLAHELFRSGYKCIGVVYDSSLDCAIDYIASSESDLDRFRGSKYIQSYTLDAFKTLVKANKDDKYAVWGTPCHIYALDKYLRSRNRRDNYMLIDLYCHGCPSMSVWKKYLSEVRSISGIDRVDNVNFRSKVNGWGPFRVSIESRGRQVYNSNTRHNEFFDLFFSDCLLNSACVDCKLRGTLEYTDIRLGDFWGKQYVLNNEGVSAVSLVSKQAKDLFNRVSNKLCFREERYEDFLPWQSWGKEYSVDLSVRAELLQQLSDNSKSIKDIIRVYQQSLPLKTRVVQRAKRIISYLPRDLEKSIRYLYYKLFQGAL